jgi:hypothetical protein
MIIADKDPGYGIRLSGVGRLGSMEVGGYAMVSLISSGLW